MMYFLFFCLLIAMGNTKDGWANAIIFIAWCVLVYLIAINGGFKE
ncbi:MAG: hypothetical protein E7D21_07120 [Veillonella sp.]|nr:hypothetical protein [Veillonella sp.]